MRGEFEAFLFRAQGQGLDGVADAIVQIERNRLDLQLAGLDLREVEDVVDHPEQGVTGAWSRLHLFALIGGEFGVQEQLGQPHDAIHRGSDLVAHISQESALGTAGSFGPFPGFAQFQLGHDLAGKRGQCRDLLWGQYTRFAINDVDRAQGAVVRSHQGSSGIEANVWIGSDQGVVSEARVLGRVLNLKNIALQDRMGTKSQISMGFRRIDPDLRFEPLAVGIDERNQGDRRTTNLRSEQGDVIEIRFRQRVQDSIVMKLLQSDRFPGWYRNLHLFSREPPPAGIRWPGSIRIEASHVTVIVVSRLIISAQRLKYFNNHLWVRSFNWL